MYNIDIEWNNVDDSSIPVGEMADGQIAQITNWRIASYVGDIVTRYGADLHCIGRASGNSWSDLFPDRDSACRVRPLREGDRIIVTPLVVSVVAPERRTVREWLASIPHEEVRQRALLNLRARDAVRSRTRMESGRDSLADALAYAFPWESTPEGASYWDSVHDAMLLDVALPDPPARTVRSVAEAYLPAPYAELFLRRCMGRMLPEDDCRLTPDDLIMRLPWSVQPEGGEFWAEVYRYVTRPNVVLPPIPASSAAPPLTVRDVINRIECPLTRHALILNYERQAYKLEGMPRSVDAPFPAECAGSPSAEVASVINAGMVWSETPEGRSFWSDVRRRYSGLLTTAPAYPTPTQMQRA